MSNRKINIIEDDQTRPISQIAFGASDVAFILATTNDPATGKYSKVLPTLCTSAAQIDALLEAATKKGDTYNTVPHGVAFAKAICNAGLPVVFAHIDDKQGAAEIVNMLTDKYEYQVKYLCTDMPYGGNTWDEYDITSELVRVAGERGDAVALLSLPYSATRVYTQSNDDSTSYGIFADSSSIMPYTLPDSSFAAVIEPYGYYPGITTQVVDGEGKKTETPIKTPGWVGYLLALAASIKSNPNYLAVAGVGRGAVPGFTPVPTTGKLTVGIAEELQPKTTGTSINCITNVRPYGYVIWGNRTAAKLTSSTVATSFLNIRNMLSDIKKTIFSAATALMFEQDTTALWINFTSKISQVLDGMKEGGAIAAYKIIRATTLADGNAVPRGTVAAIIKIKPLYAVEYFDIKISISDQDVTVDEDGAAN